MGRDEAVKILSRERDYVNNALQNCADGEGYVSPDGMIRAMDYVEALTYAICAIMMMGADSDESN